MKLSAPDPRNNRGGRKHPARGTVAHGVMMGCFGSRRTAGRSDADERANTPDAPDALDTPACYRFPSTPIHSASAATTSSATNPGFAYSAGRDFPSPATNR